MAGENMEKFNDQRVFERFNVCLPVKFIDLMENQEGCAETCDVSAKGLCLELYHEIKPATSMEMWLELPDKGGPFYTRGRVVWANQVQPKLWHTGISLEKAELMGLARIFRRP
ncbi:MAG: PilZ domain-containing protein [Candidatus Omnitrophota bacterium]|nr:PilZ domain-containing protein [Candidatus Omnitrophota bacterium]MDD5655461.1 PilZ domain-containing protein [Candidatus Omnitrophota bacterium]